MSTALSSLVTRVRDLINEPTASFWTDAELLRYMNGGINDLFRRIKDNIQDDFFTLDETNVAAAANTAALTGVPSNVAEIRGLLPRSLTSYPNLRFWPRKWTDYDFQAARASQAIDPVSGGDVFYAIYGTGGPVGAPNIVIAPTLSAAVLLALAYVPSRTEITDSSTVNPIPGESDMALVYYTVAHALGRTPHGDRTTQVPDKAYMELFEKEAAKIVVASTPRQTDEPDVAEATFELYWP